MDYDIKELRGERRREEQKQWEIMKNVAMLLNFCKRIYRAQRLP